MHRFFLLADQNIKKAERRERREIQRTKSMNKEKSEKEEALHKIKGVEEKDSELESDSHDVIDEQKLIKSQDKTENKNLDEKLEADGSKPHSSTSTEKSVNSFQTKFTENDELMKTEFKQQLSAFGVKKFIKIKNTPAKKPEKKKTITFGLIGDDLIEHFLNNKATDHIRDTPDLSNKDKILYSMKDDIQLNNTSHKSIEESPLYNNSVSNECMNSFQSNETKNPEFDNEMLLKKVKGHKTISNVSKLIKYFDNSAESKTNERSLKSSTVKENKSSFSQSSNISVMETSENEEMYGDQFCSHEIRWDLNFVNSQSTEGMYLLKLFTNTNL